MNRQEKTDLIIRMGYGELLESYDVDELGDVIVHLLALESAESIESDWKEQDYYPDHLNDGLYELGYEDFYIESISRNFPTLVVEVAMNSMDHSDEQEECVRESLSRLMRPFIVRNLTVIDDINTVFYYVYMHYPVTVSLRESLYRL